MQIDCYGFEASSQWFKRRTLDPYLIKRSEGVSYLCFGNQLNRPIAPPCGLPGCGDSPFGRRSLRGIPVNETTEVKRENYEGNHGSERAGSHVPHREGRIGDRGRGRRDRAG